MLFNLLYDLKEYGGALLAGLLVMAGAAALFLLPSALDYLLTQYLAQ